MRVFSCLLHTTPIRQWGVGVFAGVALLSLSACVVQAGKPKDTPSASPPASKEVLVLFSGKESERDTHWVRRTTDKPATWKIKDGAMQVSGGDISTKQEFGDFHLHIEFRTPNMPNAKGQAKGNSGIGLHGRYEVQVLDSYGIEVPGKGDCGAFYDQHAPLMNASKPPMEWQTYEIVFRAPRFDGSDNVTEKPRATVFQNGLLVQNNVILEKMTGIQYNQYPKMSKTGPIVLQDHGNPVEYRNIWILPLPPKGSDKY